MSLHTEPIRPYITLKTLDKNTTFDVKKGSLKKDFLDNTYNAHGYHCQPLTTANLHGWEFILKHDIEVIWDGISNTEPNHVKILKGEYSANGNKVVDTSTANATIAFNLSLFIETDPDHYSILMGPPNHFVQGAKPMTALIRSDWYKTSTLQYCWQITTPNKPVLFKAGDPFLFIMNYPKNLLENTDFVVKKMSQEENNKIDDYHQERNKYYNENPGKFANMYRKGVDGLTNQANQFLNKPFKPNPGDIHHE
jgi:hypothetical protein